MRSFLKIPADYKIKNIEKIVEINTNATFPIKYVYGSIPGLFPSARSDKVLPKVNLNQFNSYINILNKNDISFNYVINSYLTKSDILKIKNNIPYLTGLGIKNFTITDIRLIPILNNFDVTINLSVVLGIETKSQIKEYLNYGKFATVCLKEDLNRDIPSLKNIVSSANKVDFEIIINSFCLLDCPFREQHYRLVPHLKDNEIDILGVSCDKIRLRNPTELIKAPWVTPKFINKYSKLGVKYFKISGRELINDNSYKYITLYANGSNVDFNLLDLIFLGYENYYSQSFYINPFLANELLDNLWSSKNVTKNTLEKFLKRGIININREQLLQFDNALKSFQND